MLCTLIVTIELLPHLFADIKLCLVSTKIKLLPQKTREEGFKMGEVYFIRAKRGCVYVCGCLGEAVMWVSCR